jgi:subtilisin family serine protease
MSKFCSYFITSYLKNNALKGIKAIISKFRIRFLFLLLAFPVTTLFAAQSTPQTISNVQKGHQIFDEKTRILVVDENKNEVSSISKNIRNYERYVIEFEVAKNSYATKERSSSLPYSTTRVSQKKAQQLQLKTQLVKAKLIEKEIRSLNRLSNALVVAATSENAKEISMYKGVKSIRKEHKYQVSLDDSVPLTNADETWLRLDSDGQSVTGTGIKIAIIDTGIDYSHSALGTCMGVKCKVLGGYDFVNDDGDPMDDHGHGTHVAGIAAANSEQIKGVAPDALLYAYKSLDSYGSGWETDIIAAIEAAADPDGNPLTDDAVDIINMSLGGIDNGSSLMDEAVKKSGCNGGNCCCCCWK